MDFQTIIYTKDDGEVRITLNRPDVRNAIDRTMLHELKSAFQLANADPTVKVIVLTGAGGKAFSAGADIRMFKEWKQSGHEVEQMRAWIDELYSLAMVMLKGKPIVAAVDGFAVGGGFEIQQWCDCIIATENSKFGQGEINIGIAPDGGLLLPRLIPINKAKEIILTGDMLSAKEMADLGFVNKVVPRERLDEAIKEIVNKLMEKSPKALRLAKEALNRWPTSVHEALLSTKETTLSAFCSEDAEEGFKAFLEKRKPVYKGR